MEKITKLDMVRTIITANFDLPKPLAEGEENRWPNVKKLLLSQSREMLVPMYNRAEMILARKETQ